MDKEKNTLYIGNLHYGISEQDLLMFIEERGFKPKNIKIIRDKSTGKSKGFGFIKFDDDLETVRAMDALNDEPLKSRRLRVNSAERPKPFI